MTTPPLDPAAEAGEAPDGIGQPATPPFRPLGRDLRGLRKARGMTLGRLAEASGLSVSYLSLLERDRATPSIKALHAISRALGVTISWFFQGAAADAGERDVVVRRAHRRRLVFSSGIVDELLSPHLDGQLELLLSRFAPGANSGDEPYTHLGEEAGLVLRGRLELWLDGRTFLLQAGDSFGFPSTLPHRYRNPGPGETEVIWAITPPSY